MKLTDELKSQIDAMPYQQMLHRWRHAPVGDQMFQGESGDYFSKRMAEKRSEAGDAEHVRASKEIGW